MAKCQFERFRFYLTLSLLLGLSASCKHVRQNAELKQSGAKSGISQYLNKPFIHTPDTDSKIFQGEAFTTFIPFHRFPDWDPSGGTWHDNWRMQARNQPHESMVAIALAQLGRCAEAEGILRSLFYRTANSGAIEYHAMRERNRFADNPQQIGAPLLAWITVKVVESCGQGIQAEAVSSLQRNWEWWKNGAGGRKFTSGSCNGLWHWNNQYEAIRDSNAQAGHPNLPSWYDAGGNLFIQDVCPPDLNAMLVANLRALAKLSGNSGYQQEADALSAAMRAQLWSENSAFYLGRRSNGSHVPHKDIGGWLMLFAGAADAGEAKKMVNAHLNCQQPGQDSFCTAVGLPSMAKDVPGYGPNEHWLGGVWPTYTYMVAEGLAAYGYQAQASRIASSLVATIQNALAANRPLPEWYDANVGIAGGLFCPEQAQNKEQQKSVNCNYITSAMALPLSKHGGGTFGGGGGGTGGGAPASYAGKGCQSANFTTCTAFKEGDKVVVCTKAQVYALCTKCTDGKAANPNVATDGNGYYHDVAEACDRDP